MHLLCKGGYANIERHPVTSSPCLSGLGKRSEVGSGVIFCEFCAVLCTSICLSIEEKEGFGS